jgi:hypothetical protein
MRSPVRRPVLLAAAVLLLAAPASAISTTYSVGGDSRMSMANQLCVPCTVPLTGSVTIDDDGAGNVAITNVSLSHAAYQVAFPSFISVILERTSISLGAGSVTGTGSTLTSALFGATSFANTGTIACASGAITCVSLLGIPDGTYPLPSPVAVNPGTWVFDGLGDFSASFTYAMLGGANSSIETMYLFGSSAVVPESATGTLVAFGLVGLALRRRAARGPDARSYSR